MIGRIEYTSCEDGIDGISGFQIRAVTPDIPQPLRAAFLRDSVYEPPPGLSSMPGPEELARFPIAFGYSYAPEGIALYRSSYVGRDHTGRWGNYFAQALVAVGGDRLSDLPIDLWESPVWRSGSTRAGVLDRVRPDELVTGQAVTSSVTATFLATDDRQRMLPGLLALVRGALSGQNARLVLITEDSATAAQWVAAVTRSLPASLAWRVTFTTFTSRPESHSALLTFATPDVSVATYGNYRAVDLRRPDAVADVPFGEYERVVAELWPYEEAIGLVRAAPSDPPLQPDELDRFARCALLFETLPVVVEWEESSLLDGLEFTLHRSPGALIAEPWDRVATAAREIGEMHDGSRWSSVLQGAVERGAQVPGPLLQHYIRAAVAAIAGGTAPASTWLPTLDARAESTLTDEVIVPALQDGPSPPLLDWLAQPAQAGLRGSALDVLAAQVESTVGFEEFATTSAAGGADAISRLAAHHPRLRLAAQVALARQGGLDPVDVATRLSTAALPDRSGWAQVASLLWPGDPPTVGQAEALLSRLSSDVLDATGLAEDHIVQRLLADCGRGLAEDDYRLARRLGDMVERDGHVLSSAGQKVVQLVALIEYFQALPTDEEATEHAVHGMRICQGSVAPVLADKFDTTLAQWLLQLNWLEHRDALRKILLPLDAPSRRFFQIYADGAEQELAAAKPAEAALLITVWRRLVRTSDPDSRREEEAAELRNELLETVLVRGLARASRRHLERIGESPVAVSRAGVPKEPFKDWWIRWQRRHERQGLLDRFRVRGRS